MYVHTIVYWCSFCFLELQTTVAAAAYHYYYYQSYTVSYTVFVLLLPSYHCTVLCCALHKKVAGSQYFMLKPMHTVCQVHVACGKCDAKNSLGYHQELMYNI
eukprot:Lankesteria_metandrocarpae@DN9751_c0_g1_i1.p1